MTGTSDTAAPASWLEGPQAGALACLAAAFVWSSAGLVIKSIDLPALEIAGLRAVAAAAFFAAMSRGSSWRLLSLAPLLAAFSLAMTVLLFVMATKWTTAAAAIFLQSSAPAWVVLLGWLALGARPTWRDAVALAGCAAGLSLFFVGQLAGTRFLGNLAALAAGLAFGTHMLSMRQVDGLSRLPVLFAGNVIAALLALVLGLAGATGAIDSTGFAAPDARQLAALAYLGVVQIGLGYYLFVIGIRRVPALEASLLVLLEPVLNPVWVYLGTGETPGIWAALGGAIVLLTIAWHSITTHFR